MYKEVMRYNHVELSSTWSSLALGIEFIDSFIDSLADNAFRKPWQERVHRFYITKNKLYAIITQVVKIGENWVKILKKQM